jgi:hypothetical protein
MLGDYPGIEFSALGDASSCLLGLLDLPEREGWGNTALYLPRIEIHAFFHRAIPVLFGRHCSG